MNKRKALFVIGAALVALTIIACDAGGGKGGTPNPPGNNNPQGDGPLVHIVTLQIKSYDCRPEYNPGGGCDAEVLPGLSGATITIMAQAPNGTVVPVLNKKTGALVDTCGFIGDGSGIPCYTYDTNTVLPWKEEFDIPDGLVYMVWKIRVGRVPPGMRVRCEIVPVTSGTPIAQIGGGNEYINQGPNITTTGDIMCGWPVGWALPQQFKG